MPIGSLIDSQVGPYRLVDFLGAGGMGEVYRGVDPSNRVVAVKVVTGTRATPALLQRFRNEARIQASLRHPNIATVLEITEIAGQPCIVMEFVDGETLEERIGRSSGLPAVEALRIMATVTEAVGYLHDHDVIHRDLKASNIKVTSGGAAKLLDFGLARDRLTPQLTRTGVAIGTLGYMAPEQLKAGKIDRRTDIWALGVVLYESLTGTLPFPQGALGASGRGASALPAGLEGETLRSSGGGRDHRPLPRGRSG